MINSTLKTSILEDKLTITFDGKLTLYDITKHSNVIDKLDLNLIKKISIDLNSVDYIDTAFALYFKKLKTNIEAKKIEIIFIINSDSIASTLNLANKNIDKSSLVSVKENNIVETIGHKFYEYFSGIVSFLTFFGNMFETKLVYLKSIKNIRYKEIAFEINESGIKALGIISLTSFLIGLVVAYQSAYQLKIYGANIFIIDMLGISILRELAPLITAIVIAGRSGSAFTAQIGAMKITEELDAMRTMGFDPFIFLVMPRIIALMIALPILIFVSDIMGLLGGMVVASIDLKITVDLFLERFSEVVAAKHFFVGMVKGPFFAYLIASIGIYRGMMVKNDTQSIGFNTTRSVVEAIFAVIVCDAIFSIAFTNLGI
jgi:phospholipid/cholesterol/gamma-HCH transport system permease protein